uniref:Uncharacterized protein n=1 Tax=Arundo donax TaxID=35708 RepID=A0A0A9C3L6_ARUDO
METIAPQEQERCAIKQVNKSSHHKYLSRNIA